MSKPLRVRRLAGPALGGSGSLDQGMSKPLRVRRLTDREGRELQRISRRGSGSSEGSVVRWRRALVVLASAGGNTVPVIARLAATSDDRVREVIHRSTTPGWRLWTLGGRVAVFAGSLAVRLTGLTKNFIKLG